MAKKNGKLYNVPKSEQSPNQIANNNGSNKFTANHLTFDQKKAFGLPTGRNFSHKNGKVVPWPK